jgi:hypothetical protein
MFRIIALVKKINVRSGYYYSLHSIGTVHFCVSFCNGTVSKRSVYFLFVYVSVSGTYR